MGTMLKHCSAENVPSMLRPFSISFTSTDSLLSPRSLLRADLQRSIPQTPPRHPIHRSSQSLSTTPSIRNLLHTQHPRALDPLHPPPNPRIRLADSQALRHGPMVRFHQRSFLATRAEIASVGCERGSGSHGRAAASHLWHAVRQKRLEGSARGAAGFGGGECCGMEGRGR